MSPTQTSHPDPGPAPHSAPAPHPAPAPHGATPHHPPPGAPGESFDFASNRRHVLKPTSVLDATGHLVKGCLGAGILGIPEAYMKAGLWTGAIFTIIFGLYVAYCIQVLVTSAQTLYIRHKKTEMSYPDLAEMSFMEGPFPKWKKYGKAFRYAVDVIICIDLFGSCCVYEIIIGRTIQELVLRNDTDTKRLRLFILAALIPILILCMIRSLKYLSPFSLVADFFIVVCVAATVYYSISLGSNIGDRPVFKDIGGFFEYCGVVVFSMEGVGVSLTIENSMKEPSKYPLVLLFGYSVVISMVAITGFFGYWGYGETVQSPVTLNFPQSAFPTALKVLIALMIYVTFALNFYAPFNLVWYYLAKRYPEDKHWIWERVYRAIIVILITVTAVIFPNLGNMMGLLGSFCLSGMGFVFPALIETLVCWETPGMGAGRWRLWKNVLITIVGLIMFVSGTYTNGRELIKDLFK